MESAIFYFSNARFVVIGESEKGTRFRTIPVPKWTRGCVSRDFCLFFIFIIFTKLLALTIADKSGRPKQVLVLNF